MAVRGTGSRTLTLWTERLRAVAREPITEQTREAVGRVLEAGAQRRADTGVDPQGSPFPPLSRSWAERKRREGRSASFWVYHGNALGRLSVFTTPSGVRLVINVPYSKAIHDGATITHRYQPRTASSLSTHKKQVKAGQRRSREHVARLKAFYGRKTKAAALRDHAAHLKEAARARRQKVTVAGQTFARASLLPQHRRQFRGRASREEMAAIREGRASRIRHGKSSWTVRILARPILGVDNQDAAEIKHLMTRHTGQRLRGETPK